MFVLNKVYSLHRLSIYNILSLCKTFQCNYFRVTSTAATSPSDVFDNFTHELIRKAFSKHGCVDIKELCVRKTPRVQDKCKIDNKIKYLSVGELDDLFNDVLIVQDGEKTVLLANECIKYMRLPSNIIVNNTLSALAQVGNIEIITSLRLLCVKIRPDFVKANAEFNHYLAEAMWLRGNTSKAIELFEDTYERNPLFRRYINLILKYLIVKCVDNTSEVVMLKMQNLAERLTEKYEDSYLLFNIFEACLFSDWHSNQVIAVTLLEENEKLIAAVSKQISYVVGISLKKHKIEPLYKLLEVFLKINLHFECSIIVSGLFDYKCKYNS